MSEKEEIVTNVEKLTGAAEKAVTALEEAVPDPGNVLDVVRSLGSKLQGVFDEYGEQAWELALLAARLDAAHSLIVPLISNLTIALVLYFTYRLFKRLMYSGQKILESKGKWNGDYLDDIITSVPLLICGISRIVSFTFLGYTVYNLFNMWAWFGIFVPEIWIIKRALGW